MKVFNDLVGTVITEAKLERYRDWVLNLAIQLPESLVTSSIGLGQKLKNIQSKKKIIFPDTLFFFITNKCNQSCVHCFYAAELNIPSQGLTLDEIHKICRSIKGKIPTVLLCGGEPTTRPDLAEIVKAFFKIGKVSRLFITSNGVLQNRLLDTVETVINLKGHLQLRIPISLDGPEQVHDTIRKYPGGYKKAMDTLLKLMAVHKRDNRIIPLVTSVIQKGNAEVFVKFYKELRETVGCEVQYLLIRQDSRDVGGLDKKILLNAGNAEDLLPPPEVCRKIVQEIENYEHKKSGQKILPYLRSSFAEHHLTIVKEKRSVAPCVAPYSFATIFPDGGTSLCELVHPYANIRDFDCDLIKCWNSDKAQGQRKQLSACWCTYPCALVNSILRDPNAFKKSLQYIKSHNKSQ